jgi:tRNA dimethylallyltransferase
MISELNPALIAILGPTGSGKSALAMYLAGQLNGEIVACDSTQLYRGFDIGTAKPSAADRALVPHHLIDVLDASEAATAGGYRELAMRVLDNLRARQRLPIFTVGTGLYFRALVEGLADLPQRSEELRQRLRLSAKEHGPGHLHQVLTRLDSEAAKKIAPGDQQKLIRAIEICILEKRPLSRIHQAGRTPLQGWRVLKIGLAPQRDALYTRIHARTDGMLANGWLAEVRSLVDSGLPENAKPFDFIGYRELRAVLRGNSALEAARAAIQQATRRYAKRQITWFRREAHVQWLSGFGNDPEVQQQALAWVREQRPTSPPHPNANSV